MDPAQRSDRKCRPTPSSAPRQQIMPANIDNTFMRRALRIARQGWGATHPNPMVGAVIVDGAEVLAEGCHAAAGKPHAEADALSLLKPPLSGGTTLYVTLEPCSTSGRTPPCTEAIIKSGIKRVVVGATDPNPRHAGCGIDLLREAGITVRTGVLAGDCKDLNLIFNHWITQRTPLVAGKTAATLDGRIATRTGKSKWITGKLARKDVMRWRRLFPSIAVGAGTVLADNPHLTSRIGKEVFCPIRFIFDGRLRTVRDPLPNVYADEFKEHTIVIAYKTADENLKSTLKKACITIWEFSGVDDLEVFSQFRERCRQQEITGVYCEGGSNLLSSMLLTQNLDYLFSYRAPRLFADGQALPMMTGDLSKAIDEAPYLSDVKHRIFGEDQLMRGFLVYSTKKI